jgi:hypothetical protein
MLEHQDVSSACKIKSHPEGEYSCKGMVGSGANNQVAIKPGPFNLMSFAIIIENSQKAGVPNKSNNLLLANELESETERGSLSWDSTG